MKKIREFKPFDITFNISTMNEVKILLTLFEGSPHLFKKVIKEIKKKSNGKAKLSVAPEIC